MRLVQREVYEWVVQSIPHEAEVVQEDRKIITVLTTGRDDMIAIHVNAVGNHQRYWVATSAMWAYAKAQDPRLQ